MLKNSLKEVDFGGGRQSDLIRLRGLISAAITKVPLLQRPVTLSCVTAGLNAGVGNGL
jgi:hypothetical protein